MDELNIPVYSGDKVTVEYDGAIHIGAKDELADRGLPIQVIEQAASKQTKDQELNQKKKTGALFSDGVSSVQVPFTSKDAMGLLQIKAAFEMGVSSTTMVFSNGNKLPLTPQSFSVFAAWFTSERNAFYQ